MECREGRDGSNYVLVVQFAQKLGGSSSKHVSQNRCNNWTKDLHITLNQTKYVLFEPPGRAEAGRKYGKKL